MMHQYKVEMESSKKTVIDLSEQLTDTEERSVVPTQCGCVLLGESPRAAKTAILVGPAYM